MHHNPEPCCRRRRPVDIVRGWLVRARTARTRDRLCSLLFSWVYFPFVTDWSRWFAVQVCSFRVVRLLSVGPMSDLEFAPVAARRSLLTSRLCDVLSETHSAASHSPLRSAPCTACRAHRGRLNRDSPFPLPQPPGQTAGFPPGQDRACSESSPA